MTKDDINMQLPVLTVPIMDEYMMKNTTKIYLI